MKPTDPDAFAGLVKKEPEPASQMFCGAPVVECAQCHGFGKWISTPNAFGPGKHSNMHCMNCNGWGYVSAKQGSHIHEWDRGATIGNCLTRYTCAGCGEKWDVDSSD